MPPKPPHQNAPASARSCALDILLRVETGAYADRLIEAHRTSGALLPADRSLLQELVLGVLTWQADLDHRLSAYLNRPLRGLAPGVRTLLRLGAYQICHLDRIPHYAAVSETVTLARTRFGQGAGRLVNAILRGLAENRRRITWPDPRTRPDQHLALTTSHPLWMVRRWVRRFGLETTRALCAANNQRLPLTLRVNRLRTTPGALRAELRAEDIRTEPAPFLENYLLVPEVGPLFRTAAFREGRCAVQGLGAGLVVRLLDPRPGDRILDLCSAPGGKAAAAAEQTHDRSFILALDLRPPRLRTLREHIAHLGLRAIRILAADATHPPLRGRFHKVLVDAPCSAHGILSRHPEIRWRRQESDLRDLADLQTRLLNAAAEQVRPGGILVYSTCTLEPEENEHPVETFLSHRPDFTLEPVTGLLPPPFEGPYLQTFPHTHRCDGAFAARLRRTGFLGA